jgi:hypothetical protein
LRWVIKEIGEEHQDDRTVEFKKADLSIGLNWKSFAAAMRLREQGLFNPASVFSDHIAKHVEG